MADVQNAQVLVGTEHRDKQIYLGTKRSAPLLSLCALEVEVLFSQEIGFGTYSDTVCKVWQFLGHN